MSLRPNQEHDPFAPSPAGTAVRGGNYGSVDYVDPSSTVVSVSSVGTAGMTAVARQVCKI